MKSIFLSLSRAGKAFEVQAIGKGAIDCNLVGEAQRARKASPLSLFKTLTRSNVLDPFSEQ